MLRPIVIGFEEIPRVTDAAQARGAPQLAVLSAIAHPELEVAEAALGGLGQLPESEQRLYWDIILRGLPALVRQGLEDRMIKGYEYQSDFARKYYGQGRAEACASLCAAIIEAVGSRLPAVRDELAARLQDQPEDVLGRVAVELGAARDEDGVRAVLARLSGRTA